MTVLTDMARVHVLTVEGDWLQLPLLNTNDTRVARFSSAEDADLTRRILLGMGCSVRVANEEIISASFSNWLAALKRRANA